MQQPLQKLATAFIRFIMFDNALRKIETNTTYSFVYKACINTNLSIFKKTM